MCGEREGGKEGVQAKMMYYIMGRSYRGDLSTFWGQKIIFCPRNALRSPQKLLSVKLG